MTRNTPKLTSLLIACYAFFYPSSSVDAIALYALFDCYNNKFDMILHHLIVLYIYFLYKTVDFSPDDLSYLTHQMIKPEFSTIPLQLINLMKYYQFDSGVVYNFLQVSFVLSFTYYRVLDYPYFVLFDLHFRDIVYEYKIYKHIVVIFVTFYVLNLYWFFLILRKIAVCFKK